MHRECEHVRANTNAVPRLLRHMAEQQQVLMVELESIRAAPTGDETLVIDQGRTRCRGHRRARASSASSLAPFLRACLSAHGSARVSAHDSARLRP